MRSIQYIIIHETDYQIPVRATSSSHDANIRFHYIIGSEGIVRNPIDIRRKGSINKHIRGLNSFDRRDYDAYSIGIVVQGAKFKVQGEERKVLIALLRELRSHFPEAKILSTSEIDGKYVHPSNAMNQLRYELSNYP